MKIIKRQNGVTWARVGETFVVSYGLHSISTTHAVTALSYFNEYNATAVSKLASYELPVPIRRDTPMWKR